MVASVFLSYNSIGRGSSGWPGSSLQASMKARLVACSCASPQAKRTRSGDSGAGSMPATSCIAATMPASRSRAPSLVL